MDFNVQILYGQFESSLVTNSIKTYFSQVLTSPLIWTCMLRIFVCMHNPYIIFIVDNRFFNFIYVLKKKSQKWYCSHFELDLYFLDLSVLYRFKVFNNFGHCSKDTRKSKKQTLFLFEISAHLKILFMKKRTNITYLHKV